MSHRLMILATRTLLAGALAAACALAQATAVSGPNGTAMQGRRTVVAAPVAGVNADRPELAQAVIEAVDLGQRQLRLRGKPVAVDANLRVVQGGNLLSQGLRALRAGQHIRFALAPGDQPGRPVVLVYIDQQP
ncbi:MAG: hypothetical protein CFE45_02595 [Burkholderiales bacterium PBB5]|nr:MAG: hypothetical protein CFE45_02595 [Burkholderiales bacterium PBB5]